MCLPYAGYTKNKFHLQYSRFRTLTLECTDTKAFNTKATPTRWRSKHFEPRDGLFWLRVFMEKKHLQHHCTRNWIRKIGSQLHNYEQEWMMTDCDWLTITENIHYSCHQLYDVGAYCKIRSSYFAWFCCSSSIHLKFDLWMRMKYASFTYFVVRWCFLFRPWDRSIFCAPSILNEFYPLIVVHCLGTVGMLISVRL